MNRGKFKRLIGVVSILVLLLAMVTSPAVAQPEKIPLIVTFEGFGDVGISKQWIEKHGGQVEAMYHVVPGLAASLPARAIEGLKHNTGVKNVIPNLQVYPVGEIYDWGIDRIDADLVHTQMQNTGSGVNIAIMDTGIDYTHPDLGAGFGSQFKVRGGHDFADNDSDPIDDVVGYYGGHGTHCAGIAAAEKDGDGIIGVAPDAHLYALKIFHTSDASGNYWYVIEALEWAIDTWNDGIPDNEVHVISMSFGSAYRDGNPGIEPWIYAAHNRGIVLVGAAGNDGNPRGRGDNVIYPARYSNVMAVGATDSRDKRASWSSTGSNLELMAPGVDIYSTYPSNSYETWGGTSMACPHVSGTAGLVIASGITDLNQDGRINDEVRQRLITTADDLGDPGVDTKYGYGLVDADEAATGLPEPAVNVSLSTDKTEYISGTDTTAVLTAVVTDETGAVISSLDSTAFATTVDGIDTDVTFSETATAGTYRGNLDISGLSEKTHTVELTVTDKRGLPGSDTANLSIVSEPTTKTILAEKTEFRSEPKGKSGKVKLMLDVHVVEGDVGGSAVDGATVYVEITAPEGTVYTGLGDTDSNGDVTFEVPGNPQSGTWTGKVTNIEEPNYQFDPAKGYATAEINL